MTKDDLQSLFTKSKTTELAWDGKCHDCKCDVEVVANLIDDDIAIRGGAVYDPFHDHKDFFLKCDECFAKSAVLRNYRPCDIYSRSVGYMRPVNAWNEGKQAEFAMRKTYDVNTIENLRI